MAGKARNNINRLETEIEKSREESNWKRVIELAEQLKTRSKKDECLSNFLIGEGRLELFLDTCPPIESNTSKAKTGLSEAKRYLKEAANDLGKKAGVALDAHLLLGKLCYACGQYSDALEHYNLAELHTLTEKHLPIRSLRIVAESFAIKGQCLEKVEPAGSRFKQSEREAEMMRCYELASNLSLLYLQEIDKLNNNTQGSITGSHSPQPTTMLMSTTNSTIINNSNNSSNNTTTTSNSNSSSTTSGGGGGTININNNNNKISIIMELALKRSPLICIHNNKLTSAIERYRSLLTSIESTHTHDLRLLFTRQLAELLLHHNIVVGHLYVTPDKPPLYHQSNNNNNNKQRTNNINNNNNTTPWKPKRYVSLNQFVPKNENEEIILLLLISEAMAVHNAVLSQSPEFKEARIRAYQDATCVYDLLTVATVRWNQTELLCEAFERAMKFSFDEPHVWHQQALCLVTLGRYTQALDVLKEVNRMQPTLVAPCLLAAKICYEHMALPQLGFKWSEKALKIEKESTNTTNLIGRCYIYVGIGYQLQANAAQLKNEKNQLNELALEHFMQAIVEDANDHLAEYYCALQLALMARTHEALQHVRVSLALRPEAASSAALQLLALLLSASRQHAEALKLVNTALDEYPDCLNLMNVKAHLELHESGGEQALNTAKQMLMLWKNQYESLTINEAPECDRKSDTRSVFQLYTSEMSDKDSSSLQAHSVAASRVEQALSEAASSLSSYCVRGGPQRAWQLLLQIWLLLAELYLNIEQIESAQECVKRAQDIYPLSHHIMYMRGLIHVYKEEWNEAKLCFQNSVAVNPRHIKSLQQLGLIYHYLGLQRVAETTLRDACKIDPTSHQTWYILGTVLESLEEYDSASQCMAVALSEEMCSPVMPFTSVPLCFE